MSKAIICFVLLLNSLVALSQETNDEIWQRINADFNDVRELMHGISVDMLKLKGAGITELQKILLANSMESHLTDVMRINDEATTPGGVGSVYYRTQMFTAPDGNAGNIVHAACRHGDIPRGLQIYVRPNLNFGTDDFDFNSFSVPVNDDGQRGYTVSFNQSNMDNLIMVTKITCNRVQHPLF